MAQVGISEFTFGFGFLSEQTRRHWANLRVAPILPSLQQEQHEGWDAHLPLAATDYYYQFKLSDYLERSNSKYIKDRIYAGAYYRFGLHRRNQNQQHQRLKLHSIHNPNTYYVAPEFHSMAAFNSAFLSQQLLQRSRLIPLSDCKHVNDGEQHYITFQHGSARWRFHSEAQEHDSSINGEGLADLYGKSKLQFKELNRDFAAELFEKTAETAKTAITEENKQKKKALKKKSEPNLLKESDLTKDIDLLQYDPRRHERNDVLKRTSQVLSVFFGLTLVLVGNAE